MVKTFWFRTRLFLTCRSEPSLDRPGPRGDLNHQFYDGVHQLADGCEAEQENRLMDYSPEFV
jgi:hypothetical protein